MTETAPTLLPGIRYGKIIQSSGLSLEASGLSLPVGAECLLMADLTPIPAVVVGFRGDITMLTPLYNVQGIRSGTLVRPGDAAGLARPAGPDLLGRVVDALGRPLDDGGAIPMNSVIRLNQGTRNPLHVEPVRQAIPTGVRAVDAFCTLGRGQRMGLFAGSGVGKSTLLGMLGRFAEADVVVVGLVGERGREVREFLDKSLGPDGLRKSIVVAAPADVPALQRILAAEYATALAEDFRERGAQVLLLIDSITRYAMAIREVALAAGEPPTTRGYPPSVFAKIPQLIERAGNGRQGSGSITAIYTVLVEGDDLMDPIADTARAILDGHIVLTRELADQGHFPAIDIGQSLSRVQWDLLTDEQRQLVRKFRQWWSAHTQSRDFLTLGAYKSGSDPILDEALQHWSEVLPFVQQDWHESTNYNEAWTRLRQVLRAQAVL